MSQLTFLPGVAELLLEEFRALGQARVDAINFQERSDPPSEAKYERVLAGLHMFGQQAPEPAEVLYALMKWRKAAIEQVEKSGDPLSLRKRLAAECTFLEAAWQLVDPGAAKLSQQPLQALEKLAFDWIIRKEAYVGGQSAAQPEVLQARNQVVSLCGKLIGTLSEVDLKHVSSRFFSEVKARMKSEKPSDRNELLQLCEGMQHVRLPAASTPQVQAATDFLERAHPLNYVAPIRKSLIQHAFCDMLISILGACVRADMPRAKAADPSMDKQALQSWFNAVTKVRSDIHAWTLRQSKHANYGWPLVTLLTCLLDDTGFLQNIDGLLDALHRQLKDKLARTVVLTWLWQCTNSYLVRFAATAQRERVHKWLEKCTKPILSALRKGNFGFSNQLDMVRSICVTVAYRVPEFGIGALVLELMQAEAANWDATMTGLRALLTILLSAPGRMASLKGDATPTMGGEAEGAAQNPELLAMLRGNLQPLEVYGVPKLLPRVSLALSRILQACHQQFASYTLTRAVAEPVPRERSQGLAVFGVALRCVPYIRPDHWAGDRLAQDLPGYTINVDSNIRQLAGEVMHRVLRGLPHMRNAMLRGMADHVSRQPDEYPEVIREGLRLLRSLMWEWVTILDEVARGQIVEQVSAAALQFDRAQIEGLALACMCSIAETVRVAALDVLSVASVLDGALLACRTPPSGTEGPQTAPMYVGDVLNEMGADHARRTYWDFGTWAMLWRSWRPPDEEPVTFEDLMSRTRTSDDQARWARCMAEIVKSAAPLCPAAAHACCKEVCIQLQGLLPRESGNARSSLTGGSSDAASEPGQRGDLIRCYSGVACAIAPSALQGHPTALQLQRDTLHWLVNIVRYGPESLQQVAVAALGNCCPELYDPLFSELQAVIEDYTSDRTQRWTQSVRGRIRREDVRALVAQVLALVASTMPPGMLRDSNNLCTRLWDFVMDTLRFLSTYSSSETLLEAMQLRFHMAVVVRALALELGTAKQAMFAPQQRRTLFENLANWCEDGTETSQGRIQGEVLRATQAARGRLKDADAVRAVELDLSASVDYLEHASRMGMAALLLGPLFEADVKRPARLFAFINRLLTAKAPGSAAGAIAALGPSKHAVARSAMLNLLSTNPDLARVFLDQCYDSPPAVSSVFFQVLAEVNATQPLDVPRHMLLALVLHKIVDMSQEVRDDALHMLGMLSRTWRAGAIKGAAPGAAVEGVVIGNLQDSCQQFQYQLSAKLARDHPEVSEDLCVEMMTRQLDSAGTTGLQHQVLSALVPWMQNLSLSPRWKGTWMEDLMKSMYYVTLRHGAAFAYEIERLWTTVASNKHNIIPILEFLISLGLQEIHSGETEPYLNVGKRISLFLARKSPQHTIDTLVYEVKKMRDDDDALVTPKAHRPAPAVEFHHPKPTPQRQASLHRAGSMRIALPNADLSQSHHLPLSLIPQPIAALPSHLGHGLAALPGVILPDFMHGPAGELGALLSGNFRKVGDKLKSVSSELRRSEHSGSFTSATGTPARISSLTAQSPESSCRSSYAQYQPPSPVARGALTRPEVALCLLAEVAWEHDEDLRLHLPELLHASMVTLDSPELLVSQHALLAIVHLLYSLSVRHLELSRAGGAMVPEYERVKALIQHLQALRGRRLWAYEDASLAHTRLPSAEALRQLVHAMLASIFFESDLRDRWAATALDWLTCAHSRHLACRSHQVFRALRPKVSGEACSALLGCLHRCITAEGAPAALDMAVDIILTLQAMVDSLEAGRLVLFPQLLLTTVAMLPVTYIHIFMLIMDLFSKILNQLDMTDFTVQNVLLATIQPPGTFQGQQQRADTLWELGVGLLPDQGLVAVQQLILKGLYRPETEAITIEVMTQLVDQMAQLRPLASRASVSVLNAAGGSDLRGGRKGLSALLGPVEAQLALSLFSLLPWLCAHFRYSLHTNLASLCILAHANACRAIGLVSLADALLLLSANSKADLSDLLAMLCPPLCSALLQRYARLGMRCIMEGLKQGDESLHPMALALLLAILKSPRLDTAPLAALAHDQTLFQPLATLLQGPMHRPALQVLDALASFQAYNDSARTWTGKDGQDDLDFVSTSIKGSHIASAALERVTDGWGAARKGQRALNVMPFLERGISLGAAEYA